VAKTRAARSETVRRPVTPVRVLGVDGSVARERPDRLVTEEPMEIRVQAPAAAPEPLAVTMRTPGNDFELAVGLCVSEGMLSRREQLVEVAYCLGDEGEQEYNVVTLRVREPLDLGTPRTFAANASCGVCGKATLDDLEVRCAPITDGPRVARSTLAALPGRLRDAQQLFDETGGLHAAGLFGADGALRLVREDVGRHNALDKVVGWAFLEGLLPLSEHALCVSGRLSFELVQKASVAGCPVLVAVGAPSSLAVELAEDRGLTLCGFVREGRVTVYTEPWRIV
jgi:FdhD protein